MFGQCVRVLLRTATTSRARLSQWQPPTAHCTAQVLPYRLYASVGRPRTAVGEPSRPVKRAVKRASSTPSGSSRPKSKVNAKNAQTKPVVKRVKKVLTEEQKAIQEKRNEKARVAELKAAALKPPRVMKAGAYTTFMAEKKKGQGSGAGLSVGERAAIFAQASRDIGLQWRELAPSDVEHYNKLANTKHAASEAEYRNWIESHTPEEIVRANAARKALRKALPVSKGRTSKWPTIQDHRRERRISNFLHFFRVRLASGDFRHIAFGDRSKLIGQEWRALSELEKKAYKDLTPSRPVHNPSELEGIHERAEHDSPAAVTAAAA